MSDREPRWMQQFTLDLPHRPALGAADFLVAPANAVAVAWLDRWPDWPSCGLVIYGPAGCGKTHLARVWQARSGAMLLQPEGLASFDLDDLANAPLPVALDGCDGTLPERPLLHLYNILSAAGRQLLLTARLPPTQWPIALADLRSRLSALPAMAIAPPDDRLLAGLLLKLFTDRQLRVDDEVLGYLVTRMERSFAAAERMVDLLDRAALATQKRVGIALARSALDQADETE